jgi:hypothetical protein
MSSSFHNHVHGAALILTLVKYPNFAGRLIQNPHDMPLDIFGLQLPF